MKITAKERDISIEKTEDDSVLLKLFITHLTEDVRDLQVRVSRLEKNTTPTHSDMRDMRVKIDRIKELVECFRSREIAKLEGEVEAMKEKYGKR